MRYLVKWTQCVWTGEDDYDFEDRAKPFDSYADAFDFMDRLESGDLQNTYDKGKPSDLHIINLA